MLVKEPAVKPPLPLVHPGMEAAVKVLRAMLRTSKSEAGARKGTDGEGKSSSNLAFG